MLIRKAIPSDVSKLVDLMHQYYSQIDDGREILKWDQYRAEFSIKTCLQDVSKVIFVLADSLVSEPKGFMLNSLTPH